MLIRNITNNVKNRQAGKKPEILIVQSLKTKTDDPEITIGVGQIIDLSIYSNQPDEKIKNNPELKLYEKNNKIEFLNEYPAEVEEDNQKAIENKKIINQKNKILEIQSSNNLTELEDIVNDTNSNVEIVKAALIRLQELEGDVFDNPELKNSSNIIM